MSKWFKFGITGLLVFGALAVLITGAALAQDDTPETPESTVPYHWGRGFGRGMGGQVGLEAAAEALGMTVDELTTQLWGGKTLADLAEEKGVDLADVRAAVEAATEAAMEEAINQAVEDGLITQEHADWLLEGLERGFLSGFGHGFMGGFHGRGVRFGGPGFTPQLSPSSGA